MPQKCSLARVVRPKFGGCDMYRPPDFVRKEGNMRARTNAAMDSPHLLHVDPRSVASYSRALLAPNLTLAALRARWLGDLLQRLADLPVAVLGRQVAERQVAHQPAVLDHW
jgi:hypothetical protein